MLVVDLTRLSALVCQCHRVGPVRSRRTLKDQVADRNWEGLVTGAAATPLDPKPSEGGRNRAILSVP